MSSTTFGTFNAQEEQGMHVARGLVCALSRRPLDEGEGQRKWILEFHKQLVRRRFFFYFSGYLFYLLGCRFEGGQRPSRTTSALAPDCCSVPEGVDISSVAHRRQMGPDELVYQRRYPRLAGQEEKVVSWIGW